MAHFALESDVNKLIKMDAPITRGPPMRWQMKLNSSANISCNESMTNTSLTSKTPMKSLNRSFGLTERTPSSKSNSGPKTPHKTPGKNKSTPGKGGRTPTSAANDRFIPNRSASQFDLAHHLLTTGPANEEEMATMSPSKKEYLKLMSDNLNGDKLDSKILSYKNKAPSAPEGYLNHQKVMYSQAKTPSGSCKKVTRHIPQVPERILDAPEILDDYYLNLLDWSCNNHLAVCLGGHVYLWNAASGDITQLMEMDNQEEYISSVAWIKEGNFLAVGTSTSEVQLWDVAQQKKLRTMTGHVARVGCLSWNSYILSSGSRSGDIHHHDVRVPDHHVGTLSGHNQEVCGLKWSPDGKYLASGGNDNILNIWLAQSGQHITHTQPLYSFSQHMAAVKALAWCPWQPSLLASGGGTADRNIRFWNCNTGSCVASVDTKSQVCALLWSEEYKELISSHGFAQNQLIIWKYPSMAKVSELTGHTSRVLHMAMSPDGTTVVSAAADETLRLWKCFDVDPIKKKSQKSASKSASSAIMRHGIR